MLRRRGFTLIELLVVIAIIGILAAMLFPVFARAREAARKIQCLSNVKNIAMAYQMYLTDYDAFPPHEHNPAAAALVADKCDGGIPDNQLDGMNPYLRWPVIFDEYIKNRDVWRCPSAKITGAAATFIMGEDWIAECNAHEWGDGTNWGLHCAADTFPPGWGGTITDSWTQPPYNIYQAEIEGAFVQNIGTPEMHFREVKTSQLPDPAITVVAGDSNGATYLSPAWLMFPDYCSAVCGSTDPGCCNAPDSTNWWDIPAEDKRDAYGAKMSKYTRHMGGSNLGFADGHAKWWSAGAILSAVPHGALKVQQGNAHELIISLEDGRWSECICEYRY